MKIHIVLFFFVVALGCGSDSGKPVLYSTPTQDWTPSFNLPSEILDAGDTSDSGTDVVTWETVLADQVCTPDCQDKECGDGDGCGGRCVDCPLENTVCNLDEGQCECPTSWCGLQCCPESYICIADLVCEFCEPNCLGKECGPDGCGELCGICDDNEDCTEDGVCQCVPQCQNRECGPDNCGGTCGSCPSGMECLSSGKCCAPSCLGKVCGPDGCGGSCGACFSGKECKNGKCVCAPSCAGKDCGPDGCGGTCGYCSGGADCLGGKCQSCYSSCSSSLGSCNNVWAYKCIGHCVYWCKCYQGDCDIITWQLNKNCSSIGCDCTCKLVGGMGFCYSGGNPC